MKRKLEPDISFRLRASEEKYRTFFENSMDAILITSQDGRIFFANKAACEMLGREEKDIVRLGRKGIVDQTPQLEEALAIRRKTGRYFGEIVFIKKDGTRFPVEISSSVFTSDGKELTAIIARDITERRNIEKALQLSEERLRLAGRATGFGTYSYDFVNGDAFYSDEFLALYGLSHGQTLELDSDLIAKALWPEDKPGFLSAMTRANDPSGSGILDFDYRIYLPDSKIRWLKVRGLTSFSGNSKEDKPLTANGIIQDITDRKEAEILLAESTALLSSIIDSTSDLIWSVDPESFRLLTFNKALESFFLKNNIIIKKGMLLKEILPGEIVDKLNNLYTSTLLTGSLFTEYHTTLGNLTLWINLKCLSRDNKPYAISVFAKDVSELKKSERALRHAIEWQEMIFEGSIDAIFISDKDSKFVAVNKSASSLTGYSKEELLRMRIPDLYGWRDVELYDKVHDRIFNGEVLVGEAKVHRKDGAEIDAEFNNSRIEIAGEAFMHTTARDISQRKLAETALRESEARFRNLFNTSLVGISVTLPSGKILEANNAYAQMYGYESPRELIEEVSNIKQLYVHKSDREKVLKSLCEDGKMEESEIEVFRRDGSKFFVLVTANEVRDADGNLIYNQATHIDLTDRKKTEEKARNASLYSRSLIEASLDPLITINSDGKITDVNMSTEEITGVSREELIGSDFSGYFANHQQASRGYKLVFSQGYVKNYPLTILNKDGHKIDVLFNASVFRNVSGEIQGVLAAARDITELKRMEEELLNSKKLLENLNQHLIEVRENERSEIALNLHDDLGQRLTAINLDVAWLKGRVGVQTQTVINKFNDISKMINETIDGLKEISSFLRPAILYDLGIVTAIEWQLRSMEKISGIKCDFIHVLGDHKINDRTSLILYRVLQESLTNVVRHSGATTVKVSLNVTNNEAVLSIEDNGKGIDAAKINALTSMGITGIKERVASVSGKVTIYGKKNKGTTVLVKVPLKNKSKL